MSAQSEKKRRISSRRRVANPSKISEADGFLVTGSTSVEPPCIPEEKTESLNPENSQSETQKPPSPEVTMNRRKLGSSRRNKGGQHVKSSESYLKPKEKVEEQTSSHETEKTIEMPLAIQPQRQEELSQGSESATHDSSLYLASTPDYNSEVQSSSTTACPETDQKSLTPENVNFKIEIMHGGTNKSDTPQSEEIKEIAGPVGISELTSVSALSCPTVDQQLFDKSYSSVMSEEELTTETVYSVTAKDDERDKGEEMSKQDGNLQGSHVVSESLIKSEDIEFSGTQEVATDKSSPGEKKELECSVEQAAFSSSSEEVLRDEEQNKHFNLSEVKGAQHSEDHFNNMHEQEIKPAEMHDTKNPEVFFGKNLDQADVRNTNQCELTVERTDSCAEQEELYSVKQAEHPTKENNSEAFEDRSEDYYTRDAKKSQNSAERVETALIRVDETEGQVQDDRRPSGEQTVRLEREGLLSERDDSESSSQTLQSQMNAPLDSYPQQNDTDFNPIGNRRKLGSRRRHKGPKQVKETVAESYHILTDEDVKNTRDDEPIETAIMSFTLETEEQEKSMEIIQEGADTFDTAQAEELSSQVKENAHDISELTASSLLSSLTADQQLLDQSNYKEMPEKLDESKKGDNDTELFCQSGNLQDNSFVGESPVKSEEVDSSMKQEVLMEKHISREHIETEYSVEQTIVSSPKEKLLTSEEHEHFNLPEIKAAQYSEAVVDEAPEQETEPTEIHGIDHFSDSVTHDATENFEKISGNLMDKAELIVKSTDDCSANQGDLNPDNEKLEQPTKENKLETSEQTNEGNEVYATKIPQLSNTESIDPTQGQVYDTEAQVENYIKPSAKSAVDQEKEAFLPKEETDQYALQTLQSEIDASSDSQQQQYNTDLNPFGSRRKLGSSRRNKGRQHAKDCVADSYHRSTDEVVGNTSDIEPSETTKISLMIETAVQEKSIKTVLEGKDTFDTAQSEEVSDHIKESAHDGTLVGISELTTSSLHSSVTAGLIDQSFSMQMPEEELPNVFSVSEAETKEGDEETKHSPREPTELECSLEQGMVPSPKEELPTNEDENGHFNLTKVKSCHFSEEAVNVVLDQELNPTEMHDIDPSSERVTRDATDELEIICGNVVDQAQIKDTNQPEEMVKSTGDCAEEQEDLNPDDEKHEYPTKENDFENLEHTSENNNVCDTMKSHITDTERVDTALSQVYESEGQEPSAEQAVHQEKEGVCSEDEEGKSLQTLQSDMHVSLDFQTQHNDTNSNPFGSRRKLGSSRRNKGRQHAKDSVADSYHRSTDEVVGNTSDIEPSETTKISLTIETAVQEKSIKTMLEGKDTFHTAQSEEVSDHIKESAHDGTLVGISELTTSSLHSNVTAGLIDQSFSMQMPEEELPNVFSVSEAETKEGDEETKHSPREPTELECSLEQGMVPSPKEELPTNEDENGHFNLTKVKSCHFSEEAVNVVLDQELNPTEMHDIDPSSERVTHDATDELEIICGNVVDQAQIKDTNQPEEMVKSTGDCAEEQEDLNPDDEKHEYPTKENDFENLEHTSENNNVCDTVKSHITDTERVDTALSQVYESEGQEPSAEQAVHQEKEGVCSEDEEGKSLQTLQSDVHVSLDFQTQHNDTNSNPFGSRRKLGSSRRSKGRQHAKDSVADSYQRSTDEVVGNTSDIEPSETTKISLTIETAVQEKSSKTVLEGKDTYDTAQSEEVSDHIKESAHDGTLVGISKLTTSSLHSSVTAGLIDQSFSMQVPEEELPNLFSVSEAETKEGDEETKHSPREPTELECSLEQGMVPSPKEELPTNEDENGHFNLTKVKSCHFSEEAVNVVLDQELNPTEMHNIDPSSERVTRDATDELEIICGNVVDQAQIKDTNQPEEMVKSTGDCAEEQEDLNPDDDKHEYPTKENDFEDLEHTSENNNVCDTMKSHITGTERVDTALSQVYESEGQEPSAEQAVHQEKEGVCSEDEEGKSLQTLQSDVHVSLDFQTQHNDTNSNPFGSRRKLGSSRRSKGRQHAKDSVADSYQRSTDEVVGNTSDIEPSETTKISLTIETAVQEKSSKTVLEGKDTYDTAQSEEVSDHIKESAHDGTLVGISKLTTSSLHSSVTAGLIDQSFSMQVPEEELPNLFSVSEAETKEGDEETKHSPREPTELECSLEQGMVPSPKEELPTNEDENGHFNLTKVKSCHFSEEAVNVVLDQELNPTEMHDIDPSGERVTRDATDELEIICGNVVDQAQIKDTNQPEEMVKSTGDCAEEQEDLNPDDDKHEYPTKENDFEDLEHTSENNNVCDTMKSHITGTERVDTALSQVYESEGQEPSAEQAVHQEKEGVCSEDEEGKSLQTLQSDVHVSLDFQTQHNDTNSNPFGSRRKLGSSRRNKGRQHAKDSVADSYHRSTDEVVGNTSDVEASETTEVSMTVESSVQEKSMDTKPEEEDTFDVAQTEDVADQVKENVDISEVMTSSLPLSVTADQKLIDQSFSTEMPQVELPNVYSVTDRERKEGVEDTKHSVIEHTESECILDQAMFPSPKEEFLPNEENEHFNLPEVKGAHQSEDAVNTVLDQEKHRAEQLEINPFHESMKHDATDCSEVISGNLIDDAQINDINQSEVMVESAENSAVEQEDSHPDDEKHEHPTKENNFEDLEHTSENNYERDTKKSHISGTERVDTAPSQVNTSEDRVEDDIKSSAEQAVNEEKEGTLSEDEESKSAQTLQPETSTPLDSQLQKNYTDFKPVVSRRKLGSTRRNKGKQQIKEFVAQSCQSSTEELVANAEDNEPFEITKMLVTIETAVQEKSVETMQDTAQTEVNDQAKENPNLGISELPASRLQLSTVEQINVPFLRERESMDEEMGSEFLGQDGSLEEDIESSPQISKEKQSPTEHIQHEHSAEPAIASSPEGLPKDEEQNDHFNVSEDKGGQHSEHAVNKVHDEDADPTGMHEIDHSSKSVTHEALGDFEMICGNLIDKPEVYDTTEKESKGGDDDTGLLRQNGNVQANYLEGESHLKSENQSSKSVPLDGTGHFEVIPGNLTDQTEVGGNKPQSMVRSTGEFAANQESSNSDDLKDKHPKDDNFQAVEQTNEDDHVHKKITQISGIEVDTAQDQLCQVEGRVEDHMQLCATQQEREGLVSENEEGNSSLQKLHPEENLSVDSEPQQYKTDLHRLGNRRKLGSSRRNKKQQQVKESVAESCHELKVEVVESIRGSETVNTTQMLVAIERTNKEELSQGSEHEVIMPATQDCSLHSDIMPGYSSEGQSPNPETYQESSISLRDNQQEDHDKSETVFKVEESNRSDGASLEGIDKSKESSLTSDEHEQFNLTEVRAAHYSEDAVDKTQEQEVKFTEMHKINLSSESATHDATKGSEIISVSLIGKAEASETNLFELTVKCEDDSDAKQGDLNPDDKQDEHPTKGNNFEALAHTNKDYSVCDTKRTQISGTERVDTATSLVCESEGQIKDDIKPSTEQTIHQEKEGIPSEDEENKSLHALQPEMHAPLDLEPQQSITKFSPIGSRRKLGSSHRNKGRQHVKDSVGESSHRSEEPVGNNRDNETIEPGLSLEIGTAVQEQSVETIQDIVQTEEVSDPVKAHVGISELPASSLHSGSNLQDNYLVSEPHLKTEDIEASVTPEMSTGKDNPRKHTEPNDIVEQAELSSSKSALSVDEEQKEHVSLSKVSGILHSEDVVSEVHEDAVEPTQMQEMHHIDLSSVKETESLQILQSEINAPLVSQPQDSSVRIDEQAHTGFNPAGTRRKLGSSRRNKGRQQMKNSVAEQCHEQNDDVVKTTNVSFATETTRQAEIQKKTELDQRPHDIRMITSTGEENSDTFQKEDKILSQIVVDNSAIVSLDDASSSGNGVSVKSNEDTNEEGENLIKEPENSHQLAGYDSVKIDLIQSPEDDSDIRIRYDDSVTTRPITLDALEQEDASHDQKGEVSSCDKDSLGQEMNMQQTNDTVETAGDLTVKHSDTEAERQVDVKVFGQDDGGEKIYESTKADHEAQEMNPSQEIRYAAHSSAPFGLKENFRAELTMDVPEESGMSTLVNTSDRQQGIQEKTRSDNSENLQGQSKQRRRKMGSTRRTQVKRGPEAAMDDKDETKERDFNKEADMRDLDEMEVLEEITRGVTADVSQHTNANPPLSLINEEQQETNDDKGQELQSSTSDLQSNVISHTDSLTVALTEELAVADVEIVNSEIGGGAGEEHKDGQVSKTNDVNEGANNKNLEMKSASPHRRRKMGSTRKNLGSRSRREVLNQEQEVESEATDTAVSVEDVKTQSFPRLKEKEELQLHTEDKEGDSELRKEKVFETVTHRETVESHFKPPPHQTFEENPVSHGQVGETEHQLTPSYSPAIPSTSPKHDAMSETSGRRVRKFGSHRKSRGHQNNENLTAEEDTITHTQRRGDARSITGEGDIKTTEEESPHLDKIPEVDENEKKPSSHASSSGTEEHSRSVSERTHVQVTPVQHPRAEMRLSPENQRTLSLAGGPAGAALTSKGYNVLMVGDSSVGKTSFMKRAQCGKFFLDLPASIGLDFCMWTVVVDGKPVVLKLWDTAGQERFRSVTRQSFHRAQAFLLMYDITSPESFSAVSYWAHCIQEEAVENVTILLLGNKSDRANRQIRTQDGEILAKEYNFEFMECSAATGENVIQSLETVARILSQKADTREETTVLHKEPQQQKSSGCC